MIKNTVGLITIFVMLIVSVLIGVFYFQKDKM